MVDPRDHLMIGVPELSFGTEDGGIILTFNDATVVTLYIIMNERQLQPSGLPNIIILTQLERFTQPCGIRWSRYLRDRHTYGIHNIPVAGFRSAILEFTHSDHAQSPGITSLVTIGHPIHRWTPIPRLLLRVGSM
jgi:hypothetical protein